MVADEWQERTTFVFLAWFITEYEGTTFLRNVGNDTPYYTASQPTRPESSTTRLWNTQKSKQQCPLNIRFKAQQPLEGQGFLIIEASRSHSIGHTTLGRIPLDESSARSRDLCLTTRNTRKRQISMPRWDSNPQSQQACGRRPTLRPMVSAAILIHVYLNSNVTKPYH